MIGLPDHRVLVTQDLVYNAVHVFIGEQAFDEWAEALERYRALPYNRILPGHGSPGRVGAIRRHGSLSLGCARRPV